MESEAARHVKITRTTLRTWEGLELQPNDHKKSMNKKWEHVHKVLIPDAHCLQQGHRRTAGLVDIISSRPAAPNPMHSHSKKALSLISSQGPQFRASEAWLQHLGEETIQMGNSASVLGTLEVQGLQSID